MSDGVTWERLGEDTAAELMTNIEQRIKHHSPTGFNVGYAGSGPADFALNIVQLRLEQLKYDGRRSTDTWNKEWMFKDVWEVYQVFKSWFLIDVDIIHGHISWEAVDDFLKGCSSPNIRAFMHGEAYEHQHICKPEMMEDSGDFYFDPDDELKHYLICYCGECLEDHLQIDLNTYIKLSEYTAKKKREES